MTWRKIGSGSFNTVYINTMEESFKKVVFKVLKNPRETTDLPERSVYLWNQINPSLPPAQIHEDPLLGKGWLAPFIRGEQASDKEISLALIDIYQRTGRIIIDALSPKNFMRTEEGQVLCIDIGMALQLEPLYQQDASPISVYTWLNVHQDYNEYFLKGQVNYSLTVATIKALLYLKLNPSLFKDQESLVLNVLKQSTDQRQVFANHYERQHQQLGSQQLKHLLVPALPSAQPFAAAPIFRAAPRIRVPFQTRWGIFYQRTQQRIQPYLAPPQVPLRPTTQRFFPAGALFSGKSDPLFLAQAHVWTQPWMQEVIQ